MNVKKIVREWLEQQGCAGLVSDYHDLCDACEPGCRGPDPSGDSDGLLYPSREGAEAAAAKAKEIAADKHSADPNPKPKEIEK